MSETLPRVPLKDGSGYYWMFSSSCCQNPPTCGCLHGPPIWSVVFATEWGVMTPEGYVPLCEYVGILGPKIVEPDFEPDIPKEWNEGHYTINYERRFLKNY